MRQERWPQALLGSVSLPDAQNLVYGTLGTPFL